jgi:hypothetical protein
MPKRQAEQPYWELMGVWEGAWYDRNLLKMLVAGVGFEPTTFGL